MGLITWDKGSNVQPYKGDVTHDSEQSQVLGRCSDSAYAFLVTHHVSDYNVSPPYSPRLVAGSRCETYWQTALALTLAMANLLPQIYKSVEPKFLRNAMRMAKFPSS